MDGKKAAQKMVILYYISLFLTIIYTYIEIKCYMEIRSKEFLVKVSK